MFTYVGNTGNIISADGGAVLIRCKTITTNTGNIRANGGAGGTGATSIETV